MLENIFECTRCKKTFEESRIKVRLHIDADRKTNVGTWEKIANMNIDSNEVLCPQCFDLFVASIDKKMNKE